MRHPRYTRWTTHPGRKRRVCIGDTVDLDRVLNSPSARGRVVGIFGHEDGPVLLVASHGTQYMRLPEEVVFRGHGGDPLPQPAWPKPGPGTGGSLAVISVTGGGGGGGGGGGSRVTTHGGWGTEE